MTEPGRSLRAFHSYPQVKETVEYQTSDLQQRPAASRRPSLPKLQTAFSQPQKSHRRTSKPLPGPPPAPPEGLSSQPCYYFHARNCNGYVLGGSHGDACETCAVSCIQQQRNILTNKYAASWLLRSTMTRERNTGSSMIEARRFDKYSRHAGASQALQGYGRRCIYDQHTGFGVECASIWTNAHSYLLQMLYHST